jgi:hypothetical protein
MTKLAFSKVQKLTAKLNKTLLGIFKIKVKLLKIHLSFKVAIYSIALLQCC